MMTQSLHHRFTRIFSPTWTLFNPDHFSFTLRHLAPQLARRPALFAHAPEIQVRPEIESMNVQIPTARLAARMLVRKFIARLNREDRTPPSAFRNHPPEPFTHALHQPTRLVRVRHLSISANRESQHRQCCIKPAAVSADVVSNWPRVPLHEPRIVPPTAEGTKPQSAAVAVEIFQTTGAATGNPFIIAITGTLRLGLQAHCLQNPRVFLSLWQFIPSLACLQRRHGALKLINYSRISGAVDGPKKRLNLIETLLRRDRIPAVSVTRWHKGRSASRRGIENFRCFYLHAHTYHLFIRVE